MKCKLNPKERRRDGYSNKQIEREREERERTK
jgi:hypothetical protein